MNRRSFLQTTGVAALAATTGFAPAPKAIVYSNQTYRLSFTFTPEFSQDLLFHYATDLGRKTLKDIIRHTISDELNLRGLHPRGSLRKQLTYDPYTFAAHYAFFFRHDGKHGKDTLWGLEGHQ